MHTYIIPSTGERVLLVRNPWKRNNYHGEWDFGKAKWTAEAREVCKYDEVPTDGGYFFMSMDEYYDGFALTSMNYDTSNMHQDYFLMLDDQSEKKASGNYCRQNDCTSHTLTVKNTFSEDQLVHIGAHIWQDRGYSTDSDCSGALGWGKWTHHEMWLTEDESTRKYFDSGSEDSWFEPILMEAGSQLTLNLLFDWTREGITKDWSATAWGENGSVEVLHNDNIQTNHMPKSGLAGDEPLPPSPEPTPDP